MSKSFRKDLTGQRFGRLTVIGFVPTEDKNSYWKCECECGNINVVSRCGLIDGTSQSCGCKQKDVTSMSNTKHGQCGTQLYHTWSHMKSRCYNPHNKDYQHYGARGIVVCDEWKDDFETFYKWAIKNGYRENLTIDRKDVNGIYEPSNCRFTNMTIQSRNRRNNIMVKYNGNNMSLPEAAEKSGIDYTILNVRYYRGDRGERLFRPVEK